MKTISQTILALATISLGMLTACSDTTSTTRTESSDAQAVTSASPRTNGVGGLDGNTTDELTSRQLAQLRRATAAFQRPQEAEAAGYTVLVTHPVSGAACLQDPTLGGMGRHLLNPSLVDASVTVQSPEVLIYEPGPTGELRLVGVEYVIPFDILSEESTPPTLFGREFSKNFTFNLWALHVWPWKHNPSGMFADWNPSVSCEHDASVAP